MAARGAASKEVITQRILETFGGSFVYGKEIRVPVEENGEIIQIKITLTAAKTNVESGSDVALPGEKVAIPVEAPSTLNEISTKKPTEPSQEEKDNLAKLVASIF